VSQPFFRTCRGRASLSDRGQRRSDVIPAVMACAEASGAFKRGIAMICWVLYGSDRSFYNRLRRRSIWISHPQVNTKSSPCSRARAFSHPDGKHIRRQRAFYAFSWADPPIHPRSPSFITAGVRLSSLRPLTKAQWLKPSPPSVAQAQP